MLVLNRREGERTIITVPPSTVEQRIVVVPVDVRKGKLRIGFEAAPEVIIHREEVQEQVDAGKSKPVAPAPPGGFAVLADYYERQNRKGDNHED